jgi:hypothetical protein
VALLVQTPNLQIKHDTHSVSFEELGDACSEQEITVRQLARGMKDLIVEVRVA